MEVDWIKKIAGMHSIPAFLAMQSRDFFKCLNNYLGIVLIKVLTDSLSKCPLFFTNEYFEKVFLL